MTAIWIEIDGDEMDPITQEEWDEEWSTFLCKREATPTRDWDVEEEDDIPF